VNHNTRFQTLVLTADHKWDRCVDHAVSRAQGALHQWPLVLANALLDVSVKVQVIRSSILPSMLYDMEVRGPDTRAPQKASASSAMANFAHLDDVVRQALRTAVGTNGTPSSWQDTSCVSNALLCGAVLPTHAENDLAHLRMLRLMRRVHLYEADAEQDPLVAATFHHVRRVAASQCWQHFLTQSPARVRPCNRI
jgi:hypothetical protein